jgi:hypothetical protein
MTTGDILQVGLFTLIANAFVAFLLNVSVVLLVCAILNFGLRFNVIAILIAVNRLARPMLSF